MSFLLGHYQVCPIIFSIEV